MSTNFLPVAALPSNSARSARPINFRSQSNAQLSRRDLAQTIGAGVAISLPYTYSVWRVTTLIVSLNERICLLIYIRFRSPSINGPCHSSPINGNISSGSDARSIGCNPKERGFALIEPAFLIETSSDRRQISLTGLDRNVVT